MQVTFSELGLDVHSLRVLEGQPKVAWRAVFDNSSKARTDYYALPSSPEGARRCPDRGNAGGALVFWSKFYTVL